MTSTTLLLLCLCLVSPVGAWEVGASLLHDAGRHNVNDATRGAELRFNFGGDGPRYQDDRWSISIGRLEARTTGPVDKWIDTPKGCCALADTLPDLRFVTASHRWYSLPRGPARFYAAFGLAYRNVKTCVTHPRVDSFCWRGTAEVSSAWAFHLSAGVRFWNAIELAIDHSSTGRVSELNLGEDVIRLSFVAQLKR